MELKIGNIILVQVFRRNQEARQKVYIVTSLIQDLLRSIKAAIEHLELEIEPNGVFRVFVEDLVFFTSFGGDDLAIGYQELLSIHREVESVLIKYYDVLQEGQVKPLGLVGILEYQDVDSLLGLVHEELGVRVRLDETEFQRLFRIQLRVQVLLLMIRVELID